MYKETGVLNPNHFVADPDSDLLVCYIFMIFNVQNSQKKIRELNIFSLFFSILKNKNV